MVQSSFILHCECKTTADLSSAVSLDTCIKRWNSGEGETNWWMESVFITSISMRNRWNKDDSERKIDHRPASVHYTQREFHNKTTEGNMINSAAIFRIIQRAFRLFPILTVGLESLCIWALKGNKPWQTMLRSCFPSAAVNEATGKYSPWSSILLLQWAMEAVFGSIQTRQ